MAVRRQNFQNISWFWDLKQRDRLEMSPPYQRRSVWSEKYRQEFIDTLLLNYPAPAIFLFPRIDENGATTFELVDGKQRLTTIFDFLEDKSSVSDSSPLTQLRGKYFSQLPPAIKVAFYEYDFSVEYLPTNNEAVINGIFDRLNRNVANLTPQELRHAQFNGKFITTAERLADWLAPDFDENFPRIAPASRRQMKDVELIAMLLLLLEEGPKSYSVATLDDAFGKRDEAWDRGQEIENHFREIMAFLRTVVGLDAGSFLKTSRFRNQTDFYSLFGAVSFLWDSGVHPEPRDVADRLHAFNDLLADDAELERVPLAKTYLDAARSASNDTGPRQARIGIMSHILSGRDPRAEKI